MIKKICFFIINFLHMNDLFFYICKVVLRKKCKSKAICCESLNLVGEHNITPLYDLHIIIPCYNSEKTLLKCLDSVFTQITSFSYFVSVINDGSTDKSMDILKQFENRPNFKVITKLNGGLSSARNEGLKQILGNYIMFIDSDDFISKDSIQRLLMTAYRFNSDIVEGDLIQKKKKKFFNRTSTSGFVCGKLYKNIIFKNLIFPVGVYFEDTIGAFLTMNENSVVSKVDFIVYNYYQNPNSICHSYLKENRIIDTYHVTYSCLKSLNYFGVKEDFVFSNFFKQININFKRSKSNNELCKRIFVSECELYDQYFYFCKNKRNTAIKNAEYALKNRNFSLFRVANMLYKY